MRYRFGPFTADRTIYRVFEGDRPIDLTPKLLDLLFFFLQRPATLATKEDLLEGVWPGANVTDNALAQAISELRDALGDDAGSPSYIRTVARRGYRFIAPVEPISADAAALPAAAAPAAGASPGAPAKSVAVLDFTNLTSDGEVAWLSAGIAETVTNDLAALGRFRVIDRWRVGQAARGTDGSVEAVGRALGVDLVVTGGYQRLGSTLRLTARVIDRATGSALADAKVDGQLQDVFVLQDGIVSTFARELGVPAAAASGRATGRETSSLEAYRASTEGWLKLESLDTTLVSAAIEDFERALVADSGYALAHTGLANACFVAYEMTRATRTPDRPALMAGIEHARRAIRLDEKLAEAHATLSFLLATDGRIDDARGAARRAVALEPDNWRHQYRLGHASWGMPRLRAFERAIALYPQFSYAHFEIAMVHVARGALDLAEDISRQGVVEQDRQHRAGHRFPAIGFHWLLGALAAARDRHREALAAFDRELAAVDRHRLYGPEYGALARISKGHVLLDRGDTDDALAAFRGALADVPGSARARLGEAAVLRQAGDEHAARRAQEEADTSRRALDAAGRRHDGLYLAACAAALEQDVDAAARALDDLLDLGPASFYGWTIPIEPCFRPLHDHPAWIRVLARLADRAK